MKQLAGFYVPFLFMTVPVALLFRLGELLGSSFGLSMSGIGAWLIALVIPLVAVVSPFVLFWQAGALFFMADRVSHRASRRRAVDRVDAVRDHGQSIAHGQANFARGVRGEPPATRDGQYLLGSGGSRAHALGSRLNTNGSRLRRRFRGDNGGGDDARAAGQTPPDSSRNDDFENLRGRDRSQTRERATGSDDSDDDRPWYIN